MAFKMTRISIFVVLLAMLWEGTTAQSSCTRALTGLYPCINYINGNSSTPTSSCCSQLSSIVQSQPQCLCLLLNGAASSYGININQTLALALPGACNVQTPPVSRCNAVNGPTASPATPESPPSDSSKTPETKPSDSDLPSGAGSKAVPSTNGAHSGRRNTRNPTVAIGLLFLTVLYTLSTTGFFRFNRLSEDAVIKMLPWST